MAKFYYAFFSEFKEKHFVASHKHPCWEIVYYIQAKGTSSYQQADKISVTDIDFTEAIKNQTEKLSFSDNTFIVFPPNVLHDEEVKIYSNIISIGFMPEDKIEEEVLQFALNVYTDSDLSVYKYMKKLKTEFFEKLHGYQSMLDCITRELLIFLSRKKRKLSTSSGMDYIIKYLDEYYMTNVNIDNLAQMSNYSPSRFRVLFKNKTGVSPKQYILNLRLAHIKEDLIKTQIPLSQIAFENGFTDYYQFSTFFKKNTTLSPKEYRTKFST